MFEGVGCCFDVDIEWLCVIVFVVIYGFLFVVDCCYDVGDGVVVFFFYYIFLLDFCV